MNFHQRHIADLPKGENAHYDHMQQALWMLFFRNHHSPRDYGPVNQQVAQSRWKAGSPALRLARALWSLEDRLTFPDDPKLQAIEENDFSHLQNDHRNQAKAKKYFVWQGMEPFCEMRQQLVGKSPLVKMDVPDLKELDWRMQKALCRLDYWNRLYRTEKAEKAELKRLVELGVSLHPLKHVDALDLLSQAVWWLEYWNKSGRRDARLGTQYTMANTALWRCWKSNPSLQGGPFQEAMDLQNVLFDDFPPAR